MLLRSQIQSRRVQMRESNNNSNDTQLKPKELPVILRIINSLCGLICCFDCVDNNLHTPYYIFLTENFIIWSPSMVAPLQK